MLLKIEENQSIDEINRNLQAKFPHLKLVFFKSDAIKDTAEERVTDLYVPLKEIYKNFRNAHIRINGNLQARSLELKINEITGLHVQVFRRAGKVWLETLTTDDKTLAELNQMALDSLEVIEPPDTTDYQEHE